LPVGYCATGNVYIYYIMSTYEFADNVLHGVNEAPIFTYGMISITAIVLSYMTLIEPPEPEIEENILEPISTATGMPGFSPDTEESPNIPVFPGMAAPFSPESPTEPSPTEESPTEESPVEPSSTEEVKKGGLVKKKKSRMHKPKEKPKRKTVRIFHPSI